MNAIDVALLFVSDIGESFWPEIEAGVSARERETAARFVFPCDRRTYYAAHWLKRRWLSHADPRKSPLEWRFADGPNGKPEIEGGGLHFNLSHCHGLVACAVRQDGPVGVDVEDLRRPAPEEVADHAFSPAERAWLDAQKPARQGIAFYQIWTMKEAYIKATGLGLSSRLRDFSVSPDTLAMRGDQEAADWHFHQSKPGGTHILAVAWEAGASERVSETIISLPKKEPYIR